MGDRTLKNRPLCAILSGMNEKLTIVEEMDEAILKATGGKPAEGSGRRPIGGVLADPSLLPFGESGNPRHDGPETELPVKP